MIRWVPNTKSLGLHIDKNLSWAKQIDVLRRKISSRSAIGGLKRIRQYAHLRHFSLGR